MALIWAEGFDHYGTTAEMLLGGYSSILTSAGGSGLQAAAARTGGFGFRCPNSNNNGFRRVLDTPLTTIITGIAQRCYVTPGSQTGNSIHFETAPATTLIRVTVTSDLRLAVMTGRTGGTVLGQTPPNTIILNAYHFIETKIFRDAVNGTVEVQLDGLQVLVINGLNLGATDIGYLNCGNNSGDIGSSAALDFDDLYICDTSGTSQNDFLGDRRCFTSFVDADTAFAAWGLSSGTSGFSLLNKVPPSDVDYIQGNNVGDVSEFQKDAIGISTNDIAAVMVVARAQKTDAGTATFRIGIHSNSFVSNSPSLNPTTNSTYFRAIFPLDPNGDVPWTRTSVDAATIRVTRDS